MTVPPLEPPDEVLVARARGGDQAAFGVLVQRHSGRAYAIGVSMLRNDQDARDVVQETFLNAWRKLGSYRGDAPFGAWIKRIATNSALMKLRRRRRKPETSLEIRSPGDSDGETRQREMVDLRPWADRVAEDRELGQRIRAAIAGLPDSYRDVVILADFQQLPMKDIAEALGLTVPNVKTRLHRARLRIRQELSEYLAGRD